MNKFVVAATVILANTFANSSFAAEPDITNISCTKTTIHIINNPPHAYATVDFIPGKFDYIREQSVIDKVKNGKTEGLTIKFLNQENGKILTIEDGAGGGVTFISVYDKLESKKPEYADVCMK